MMKRIKYLFCTVFILLAVLSTSELYQNYLEVFTEDFYNVTFYLPDNMTSDEMLKEIVERAEQYEVGIFYVEQKMQSNEIEKTRIYTSKKDKAQLENQYDIFSGSIGSLLGGENHIDFFDVFEISKEQLINNNTFYLLGSYDNMVAFKASLEDKYAGAFPKQDGNNNHQNLCFQMLFIWMSICAVIALLTIYDSLTQKKENFIRISLGTSIHTIVIKNVVGDIAFYCLIYTIARILLRHIAGASLFAHFQNMLFLCLCFCNSVIYINFYFYNIKKLLSNQQFSHKVLILNYIIKMLSIIGATLLLSLNIAQIYEGVQYYKQRNFYLTYKDYYYVHFLSQKDVSQVQEQFYKKYKEDGNIIALGKDIYLAENESSGVVLANENAKEYLMNTLEIKEQENVFEENTLFLPENRRISESDIQFLSSVINNQDDKELKVFYYSGRKSVLCQNVRIAQRSEWMDNPIVLYVKDTKKDIFYFDELLIHISEGELLDFIQKVGYKDNYVMENVWDAYQYQMKKEKKLLVINTVLLILIVFLEGMINTAILRMEYQVHAINQATQKVLGYTLFERNIKVIAGTLILNIIAVVVSVIVVKVLDYGNVWYILAGNIIFLIMDILLIYKSIHVLEKQNIVKILKGGCL